jgi:hypothetical protein
MVYQGKGPHPTPGSDEPGTDFQEGGSPPAWPTAASGRETLNWIRALASGWEDERNRGQADQAVPSSRSSRA